jgi:hypothetical protein
LFLFIEGGQENILIGPKNIFDQQKQRFGELEIGFFGGFDVVNKL